MSDHGDDGTGMIVISVLLLFAIFGLVMLVLICCNMIEFHSIKLVRQ